MKPSAMQTSRSPGCPARLFAVILGPVLAFAATESPSGPTAASGHRDLTWVEIRQRHEGSRSVPLLDAWMDEREPEVYQAAAEDLARTRRFNPHEWVLWNRLLLHWTIADPEGARQWLFDSGHVPPQSAFEGWGHARLSQNPNATLDELEPDLVDSILARWAAARRPPMPPEARFRAALADGTATQADELVSSLLGWARRDRDAAWAALREVSNEDGLRSQLEFTLLNHLVQQDAEAIRWVLARRSLERLPSPLRLRTLPRFYLQADEAEALTWLEANLPRFDESTWSYLATYAAPTPEWARFYLQKVAPRQQIPLHGRTLLFLKILGTSHPGEALAWIEAHVAPRYQPFALAEQVEAWGARDPERALRVIPTISDKEGMRTEAIAGFFRRWTRFDPQAALRGADTHLAGEDQVTAMFHICKTAAWFDPGIPEVFAQRLNGIPVTEQNRFWVNQIVGRPLIESLHRRGLDAVFAWLDSLPEAWQGPAARVAWVQLLEGDYGAITARAAVVPEGAIRQAWLNASSHWLALRGDPVLALERSLALEDAEAREELSRQAVTVLARTDPEYTSWHFERAALGEEDRARLQSVLERELP